MASVTQDDLLDALRQAMASPDYGDGLTGPEIASAIGLGETQARRIIRRLMENGELELVNLKRTKMNGQRTSIIGYRRKSCQ